MHCCACDSVPEPCNAWCVGDVHVDIAYTMLEYETLAACADSFCRAHAYAHAEAGTLPCAILAVVEVKEAPSAQERYPQDTMARHYARAFRITYRCPSPS